MHARVVSIRVRPADPMVVGRLCREAVLPDSWGQQGFRGALLFTDGDTGRAVSITLWESARHEGGREQLPFQSQAERVQQLMTAPAEPTYFQVESLNLP